MVILKITKKVYAKSITKFVIHFNIAFKSLNPLFTAYYHQNLLRRNLGVDFRLTKIDAQVTKLTTLHSFLRQTNQHLMKITVSGATVAFTKENLKLYLWNKIFHVETWEQKILGICINKLCFE
jgi:hypothetical protein